jgi:hypothetical protein
LPGTSLNNFTGSWSPATISTATVGTTTYTFTSTDACATTASISVTITAQVTPTFAPIGPLCQNSIAPPLPGTSLNNFTGSWSPATISTATVGTTTYTFTSTDACATTASISVTITAQVTPTFAPIGPLCQNSIAPPLPGTSLNNFTGSWSPATISTATVGTTTYTFTSTDACATTASISVTVTAQVTPTFAPIGPLCQNSIAPPLPGTSLNNFTGSWSPATISTATVGTTTYTFTSTDACATTASISVTVTAQVTPTFAPIGPLCQNVMHRHCLVLH